MIYDDTNSVINYKRYQARDIHKTILAMSDEQKQKLLDDIQLRKGTHILMGEEYNQKTCEYIESLLNGKRPKNGLH